MSPPAALPIPDAVTSIADRLEDAGYETWCVGGAVRDNLLRIENRDFDLATAAPPQEVRRLFRRTVPIGIEHGTVAVLDPDGVPHEVTTFRRDVKTDGRHAVVEFGVSLDDDLARRDFTINAIAYHPRTGRWRDLHGGVDDLARRVIRAVGDPAARFREDYLRIIRALRFAARFHFTIDAPTWAAAREAAHGLDTLSAERVRDEWFKGIATARRPSELVRLWGEAGALARWMPEVAPLDQGPRPDGADLAAACGAVDALEPRDPVLLTAYLSTDPPGTLARLRCSRAEIERGRRLAAHRDSWPDPSSPPAVRRWLAAVGAAADDLLAVARAMGRGAALGDAVRRERHAGAALVVGDLALTGDDLIEELGLTEGRAVGWILGRLLDAVLDDPVRNRRETLLARARQLIHEVPS